MENMRSDFAAKLLNMLNTNPELILYMKNEYIDEDMWRFCISREPSLFKEMNLPSDTMCEYAIDADGTNIRYLFEKFHYIKITPRMCYMAIRSNPRAIKYIPDEYITSGLAELAADEDTSVLADIANYVRPEYLKRKVNEEPSIVKYFASNIDEDVVCDALRKNPNISAYIKDLTPAMEMILMEQAPQILEMRRRAITPTIKYEFIEQEK